MQYLLRFPPDLPSGIIPVEEQSEAVKVAVPPRSPIGYNTRRHRVEWIRLRFPPDLPSGIIQQGVESLALGCGSPPISHRV